MSAALRLGAALAVVASACGDGDAATTAPRGAAGVAGAAGTTAGSGSGGIAAGGSATAGSSSTAGAPLAGAAGQPASVDLAGAWVLRLGGAQATLILDAQGAGTLVWAEGTTAVSTVATTLRDATLRSADGAVWLRVRRGGAVLAGRLAHADGAAPPLEAYGAHLTGFQRGFVDALPARVYRLTHAGQTIVLRLDTRDPTGRWKREGEGEGDEIELQGVTWSPGGISFVRTSPTGDVACQAQLDADTISGSCADGPLAGTRIEALAQGLVEPGPLGAAWRETVRASLRTLYAAGDELATGVEASLGVDEGPLTGAWHPDRDDDPEAHPAAYTRRELSLAATLPDRWGGPPHTRLVHGFVATPTTAPPPGGRPVVITLNGHGGSAYRTLDPSFRLWWGDGFARRGYVVVSVDLSHRPVPDRADLYADTPDGDDPDHGNGAHAAVRSGGLDADWEEDGERVADVLAARAFVDTLPGVDASRIAVVGVSMGAEVATLAAALHPDRFRGVVAAGFSPDLEIMTSHGNHPCWRLRHADLRDYVSVSDLHGLLPEGFLVVETGKQDGLFSSHDPPWAGDKQVLRRSRVVFPGPPSRLVHFLHYDQHRLHFGGKNPSMPAAEQGLRVPVSIAPPGDWQHDGTTTVLAPTLVDWLADVGLAPAP